MKCNYECGYDCFDNIVLILILLEWNVTASSEEWGKAECLNPYSTGMKCNIFAENEDEATADVLILILLEWNVTYWHRLKIGVLMS